MGFRAALLSSCLIASLLPQGAFAETLYFKNKRTIDAQSYEIKGALIYVTMHGGHQVYLKADSVDWDATKRLQQGNVILQRTGYDAADEGSEEAAGPARSLTASDLKKGGMGFKLRRSAAPSLVIEVRADAGWVDSRINVKAGQTITLKSSGKVTLGPGLQADPSGLSNAPSSSKALAPGKPFGALVGRIGLAGDAFRIGTSFSFVAPLSGRLFLAANDSLTSDNSGAWAVHVEMPGPGTSAGAASGARR